MRAVFIELPAFERLRGQYLDDESFRALQNVLMENPVAGDVIQGTGGLRKLRWTDKRRGKGKSEEQRDLPRGKTAGIVSSLDPSLPAIIPSQR